jgi:pimeloyl-ACP methyl ester carboxylesterase
VRTGRLLVLLVFGLAACTSDLGGTPEVSHPGETFTVNGHRLLVSCSGGPGPTVVFEAAIGGDHSLWPIADRIRDQAYACVYDRPGNGGSPAPDEPMTARTDAADLHQLLEAGNIPGPIVVVAHSYGGLIGLMEAVEHPDDIAGMILIDASHPDQLERWDAILTPEQRQTLREPFADFPYVDFPASLADAASEFGPLPRIPFTVITATKGFEGEGCTAGLPCAEMQAIWLDLQDEYAALLPDARHIEAPTGHYVHDEDPDLVVAEIRSLLTVVDQEN